MSFTDNDVEQVRHVVQRILVPCVFVVGLLGNSISICVLTRRRMRCTTNIYLTALAITDIIYLTMAMLLSLQHYQYIHLYFKIYWMCYGVVVWLCDACSYISIYIAVCFTIERFIAIRYPLKRQTFCTESLAKKVITGVILFCLFSTISTAFEHQHSIEYRMIDNLGQPCNQSIAKAYTIRHQQQQPNKLKSSSKVLQKFDEMEGSGELNDRIIILSPNMTTFNQNSAEAADTRKIRRLKQEQIPFKELTSKTLTNIDVHLPITLLSLPATTSHPLSSEAFIMETTEFDMLEDDFNLNIRTSQEFGPSALPLFEQINLDNRQNGFYTKLLMDSISFNITNFCENVTYFNHIPTALGDDDFYINVWYFVTLCIFVLIPLCVLVTFNCFLIILVRRSNTIRGQMTNANSIRRPKRKSNTTSVSQENRVTITLIAVVLLFIVCQLPWAVYLIVSCKIEIESHLQSIFGNIFNFLAATNAAANFFLYCVLSDKYRNTIREMITGFKYKQKRNTSTSFYTNSIRRSYRPAGSVSLVIK